MICLELQFDQSVISCLEPVLCQNQNQELTQELRLPDGMPDVGRVICAWAQPIVRSKEWRSDSVSMSGGLMVWVLYAPEDGTQERCVDSWIPFQMKWDIPKTDADGYLRLICQPRFADARVVSARKMMIRAGIRAMADAFVPVKRNLYSCAEAPQNVQLLKNTYPIRLIREAGERQFQIDEELQLSANCPAAEKLIYFTVTPGITEQRISGDKVIFRGNTNLHLLYLSEEGKLYSCDIEHPFSQLAHLENTYEPDAQADVSLSITALEAELTEEGHIRLKCGLVGQYLVDDVQLVELVEDAYSTTHDVGLIQQELLLPAILETRREMHRMEQAVDQPITNGIDTVLYPDHPQQSREGDRIVFNLSGQGIVLGYDENQALRSCTVRWEDEYPIDADADSMVIVNSHGSISPQSRGNGSQLTVMGEYPLDITTTATRGMQMVTGLQIGAERSSDSTKPSLILCRAGSRSLWEIAKECGSTTDAIRRVNKLEGEPDRGRMLLIPLG